MPKIHQITSSLVEIEEEIPISTFVKGYYATIPLPELDLMLFGCICGHLEISHKENEECGHNLTGLCKCRQFIPRKLEIVVEITTEDVFEFEVKDHSERDSLSYWSEFNLWRLKNEKSPILCNS